MPEFKSAHFLNRNWCILKEEKSKIESELDRLIEQRRSVIKQMEFFKANALADGFVYQYGKWIPKDEYRENPLKQLSPDDKAQLSMFVAENLSSIKKGTLEEAELIGLPELVIEQYKKLKLAIKNGDFKESDLLFFEMIEGKQEREMFE